MRKIAPTFTIRKKFPTDTTSPVTANFNISPEKGKYLKWYFSLKNLTTGKPYSIHVSTWDKKNNKCFVRGSIEEKRISQAINNQIQEIILAVRQIVEECSAQNRNVTRKDLSEENIYNKVKHIESFTDVKEPEKNLLFAEYWLSFIQKAKEGSINHNGKKYSTHAIKAHNKCLNGFKEFEREKKHHYSFDEIDYDFYDDYISYLDGKNYAPNSVGEKIKNIKSIMQRAYREELHKNLKYKSFYEPSEEVDNVYLSEKELETIYNYQFLPSDMMLEKYRDLFLVGCYTGLRWGNYKKISKNDIKITAEGNEVISVISIKNGQEVVIPFLWENLKKIFVKYDYNLPHVSEQNFNKYVKLVCLKAGINEEVTIKKGKYKRDEPYQKWELVSSHTARRSACTNMVLRGIPSSLVMKISGHRRESSFIKYLKNTGEQTADYIIKNYSF